MNLIRKLLEAVTGEDNKTLEPAYLWSAVIIMVGLGLQIYCTVTGKTFDLQQFGVGACALLAGLGVSKKLGT